MAKFAVGEIAVIRGCTLHFAVLNGVEVTIESPPFVDKKGFIYYVVSGPDIVNQLRPIDSRGIKEPFLRKRPQPPDWQSLSDPRDLPIEDKALELCT